MITGIYEYIIVTCIDKTNYKLKVPFLINVFTALKRSQF